MHKLSPATATGLLALRDEFEQIIRNAEIVPAEQAGPVMQLWCIR